MIIGAVCLTVLTMVVYAILCDILSCEMFRTSLLFVFVAMVASIRWRKEVSKIMREDTIVSINDMVDNAYHAYESANQKTRATITEANQMVDNVNDTAENLNEVLRNAKDASWLKLGLLTINSSVKGNYLKIKRSARQQKHALRGLEYKL